MRTSDKLIRQKCPACNAAITLGSSTLNKKIHCPKCRQLVIIPSATIPREEEKTAVVDIAFQRIEAPETNETTLPAKSRFPLENVPVAIQEPKDTAQKPVVYCLCNGVLKRRVLSKEWGPAKSICCMCQDEAAASL